MKRINYFNIKHTRPKKTYRALSIPNSVYAQLREPGELDSEFQNVLIDMVNIYFFMPLTTFMELCLVPNVLFHWTIHMLDG